jgi:hypothetical protein
MIVKSLEIHSKFYRSTKIMKLEPKFIIFILIMASSLAFPVYGML